MGALSSAPGARHKLKIEAHDADRVVVEGVGDGIVRDVQPTQTEILVALAEDVIEGVVVEGF